MIHGTLDMVESFLVVYTFILLAWTAYQDYKEQEFYVYPVIIALFVNFAIRIFGLNIMNPVFSSPLYQMLVSLLCLSLFIKVLEYSGSLAKGDILIFLLVWTVMFSIVDTFVFIFALLVSIVVFCAAIYIKNKWINDSTAPWSLAWVNIGDLQVGDILHSEIVYGKTVIAQGDGARVTKEILDTLKSLGCSEGRVLKHRTFAFVPLIFAAYCVMVISVLM